ncbi:bifunctional phosphoribosyl-AMP cyclohydrolase/phosphoribosyl-ATP diphosphatase HisIE [Virgibacillus pantothenticus]|uniref:bifunctional phosphoribosyl-AMP cyclohydrolase/phosphoribosyl-ATP diphosphatase HisIE n=1 Tax=Virgibacillus pantothenticus TaxID=1473 RepID=UPI001C25051E|nr:bifunctional phosphoribosyl-AMP cyclohydrolase/phosphoribosyl-ATP diphosphatase HisIE [Virgibacillus pantothenticus]MBU8565148.1 bifunctional phosphoribosyl-AMP cyclohydrolase/phosphoribosyl-ATP diphosphatase HisIE [Virgibacillus pantothenticus]MBU8601432.1 bifunctional phosphoribosyl-AMP cyclohydrolase/phosphoribosyl-ATP diphosphatase HisIE [Virgibacillus pantothenticus]MBU8633467.1 bifunctional phosphoribosyl-AMP cyclohydrolase/phosphoribosyl-ATP diphosphatase HisIE [Virgibacillus pantothen
MKQVTFDDNGLIPAIVQDADTGEVLTLAYMNEEAIEKTLATKETWFYSRKRQALWNKGATSGNKQIVQSVSLDCDQDAILLQVKPLGPACHTGESTCFHQELLQDQPASFTMINQLTEKIKTRKETPIADAYTTYLFQEGIDKILKKVGEEASEVIIAAKNYDKKEITWEIADLTYHTLVLMELLDISVANIKHELQKRHIQKGDSK